MSEKYIEQFATVLRSHIVMCHTLLPADLSRPRNLTSLSGLVLTTRSTQVTNQRVESKSVHLRTVTNIKDTEVKFKEHKPQHCAHC